MKSKAIIWIMNAVVGLVFVGLAVCLLEPAQQEDSLEVLKEDETADAASRDEIPDTVFEDEPEARALYEKMIQTMRNAESLSYTSNYRWESKGREIGRCTYTIWMKKPNYFRVETVNSRGIEGYKMSGVPLNYIIDKEGKVVDAWYGYEKGHKRAIAALEKLGLKFEDP